MMQEKNMVSTMFGLMFALMYGKILYKINNEVKVY